MIRIAICDDEETSRAYLTALIQKQPYTCEIVEYVSADAYLSGQEEIDLLFLDIELSASDSGLDGIALAHKIREQGLDVQPVIVFVTGYERYVFDVFDVDAFQYLLKPVDEEKFTRVFARAAEQITAKQTDLHKTRTLTLPFANTRKVIPLYNIYYIESSNHKVVLHLKDGEFICYAKIGELEVELQEQFFRIHKGYLVNLSYVDGYSKTELTLTNGDKLMFSKYKYQDFVKAHLRFLKKGVGL